jgi:hypothetical protein
VEESAQTTKSRLDKLVEMGKLKILADVKPTTYTKIQLEDI